VLLGRQLRLVPLHEQEQQAGGRAVRLAPSAHTAPAQAGGGRGALLPAAAGFVSTRGNVWTDVDAARCGNLPFVFESNMSFERYVDYAMDVPMYFVYRKGQYVNALGQSWRDFMQVSVRPRPSPPLHTARWCHTPLLDDMRSVPLGCASGCLVRPEAPSARTSHPLALLAAGVLRRPGIRRSCCPLVRAHPALQLLSARRLAPAGCMQRQVPCRPPRTPAGQAASPAGGAPHHGRLGEPPDHHLPGSAA
jgi:hypothetical protein